LFTVVALASCEAGWVNRFAGDGTAGTTTATVPDGQARFTYPTGIVAIPSGGFYIYDAAACAIYQESQGEISVYAGTPGTCGNSGDGGMATQAELDNSTSADPNTQSVVHGPGKDAPTPMALGADGSLYFVQSSIVDWVTYPPNVSFPAYQTQVRRIDAHGTIDTVGTVISDNYSRFITGITATPGGTVLVAVSDAAAGTATIDRIAPDGTETTITTFPGQVYGIAAISETEVVIASYSTVDRVDLQTGAVAPTGQASTLSTTSIAATSDGTIYVGHSNTNLIDKIAPDNTAEWIAGDGTADPGTTSQVGDGRALHLTPTGLALTPNSGLLISSGHVVYRLQDPANVPPS
jgi:hypothetical protein